MKSKEDMRLLWVANALNNIVTFSKDEEKTKTVTNTSTFKEQDELVEEAAKLLNVAEEVLRTGATEYNEFSPLGIFDMTAAMMNKINSVEKYVDFDITEEIASNARAVAVAQLSLASSNEDDKAGLLATYSDNHVEYLKSHKHVKANKDFKLGKESALRLNVALDGTGFDCLSSEEFKEFCTKLFFDGRKLRS